MPIFEYRCRACGKTFEKIQRQPAEEIPCPSCGQPATRSVSVFAATGSDNAGGGCAAPGGSGFT